MLLTGSMPDAVGSGSPYFQGQHHLAANEDSYVVAPRAARLA